MEFTYPEISKMIDHALLVPTLSVDELEEGCQMAADYDVASVCIMPYYVKRCAQLLKGSTVLPSTVIGFPHGGQASTTKVVEAEGAIADGAIELDMVVNISAVLSERWDYVAAEIATIVRLAHDASCMVKVIFENCYLEAAHQVKLCEISSSVGADWVKTSTGFGTGGATIEDLTRMVANAVPPTQVKAAGGIRDLETLLRVKALGVTRVGASATPAILDAARKQLGMPPIGRTSNAAPSGY